MLMLCLDFFPYSDYDDAKGQSPSFRIIVHDILYIDALFPFRGTVTSW